MTLQALKKRVENQLREQTSIRQTRTGKMPRFPMVVCLIGEAAEAVSQITQQLKQTWPQFEGKIPFVSIIIQDGSYQLFHLSGENKTPIGLPEFKTLVSEGFGADSLFQSRIELGLPFVLPITTLNHPEDYQCCLEMMDELRKEATLIKSWEVRSPLFIVGNEVTDGHDRFALVKQSVVAFDPSHSPNDFVVILSNVLNDGTILSDMTRQFQAIAACLTIFNDLQYYNLSGEVLTLAYQRQEKPIIATAQILLLALLDLIEQELWKTESSSSERLLGRMREILTQFLRKYQPAPPSINLFEKLPHRTCEEVENIGNELAGYFNRQTFGTFSATLQQLVSDKNESNQLPWNDFRETVKSHFKLSERVNLSTLLKNLSQEQAVLLDEPRLDSETVRTYIDKMLFYSLFKANTTTLFSLLDDLGQLAAEFESEYNTVMASRNSFPPIEDEGLIQFYQEEVRLFWAEQKESYVEVLNQSETIEEFIEIIEKFFKDLFLPRPQLKLSFEEELARRWQNYKIGNLEEVYRDIHQKFSKNDVTFFVAHSHMEALGTVVMLNDSREQGSLSDYLHKKLKNQIFYDTANPNQAEIITFYQLNKAHLL